MSENTVERLVAEVVGDTKDAVTKLMKLDAVLDKTARDRSSKLEVDVQGDEAANAKLTALAKDRKVNVDVDVDKDKNIPKATDSLSRFQKEALSLTHIKISGEFLMGLGKIPVMLGAIGPAASGISALAGGVVALAGSLQQMTGAALLGPAALTPIIGTFAGIKIATGGVTDLSKEYFKTIAEGSKASAEDVAKLDKAFSKVSSSTAQSIKSFSSFKDQLGIMKIQLQEPLFAAVSSSMDTLFASFTKLQPGLMSINQSVGSMFKTLAKDLDGMDFAGRLSDNFSKASPVVGAFGKIVANLANVFLRVADAGIPFIRQFSTYLTGLSSKASVLADTAAYTGKLSDAMERGIDAIKPFASGIKDLGVALSKIMSLSADTGNGFVQLFADGMAKFKAFTSSASGENKIKAYIEGTVPALREAGLLIKDLSESFFKLDEAGKGPLLNILRTIRTGILPALEDLTVTEAGSGLLESLVGLVEPLIDFLALLKTSSGFLVELVKGATGLAAAFSTLLGSLGPLGDGLSNLLHAFALLRVVGVGGPIALGIAGLVGLVTALTGDAKDAIPVLGALGAAFLTLKAATAISNIGGIAGAMGGLTKGATGAASGVGGLGAALGSGGALALTGATIAASAAVALAVGGLIVWQQNTAKATADTKDFAQALRDLENASSGDDNLQAMKDTLGDWVESNGMTDDLVKSKVSLEDFNESLNKNSFVLKKVNGETLLFNENHNNMFSNDDGVDQYTGSLKKNAEAMVESGTRQGTLTANIGHYSDKMKDAWNEQTRAWIATGKLTEAQVDNALQTNVQENGFVDLTAAAKDIADILGADEASVKSFTDSQAASAIQIEQWNQALASSTNQAALFGEALNENFGAGISAKLQIAELTDSYKALTDAIGGSKDKSVEGLTTNVDVLNQFANLRSGAVDFARSMVETGSSVEEASGWLKNSFIPSLDDSLAAAGLSAESIAALKTQLGLLPENVDLSVKVYDQEIGLLKLRELYDLSKKITDEDLKLEIESDLKAGSFDVAKQKIDNWVASNQPQPVQLTADVSNWEASWKKAFGIAEGIGEIDTKITLDADISKWTAAQIQVLEEMGVISTLSGAPKITADIGEFNAATGQIEIDITDINNKLIKPQFGADTTEFDNKSRRTIFDIFGLTNSKAVPKIDADAGAFDSKFNGASGNLNSFNSRVARPSLDLNTSGFDTALNAAEARLRAAGRNWEANWARMTGGQGIPAGANGGIRFGYADGGTHLPSQAKIQSPVGSRGLIQWAEPETKGEAFIPLAMEKRKRSRSIWLQTGRLLGMDIDNKSLMRATPMAAGGINADAAKFAGISQIVSNFRSSPLASDFAMLETIFSANGTWGSFLEDLLSTPDLRAVAKVLEASKNAKAWLTAAAPAGPAGPATEQSEGAIGSWLANKGNLISLRAQSDFSSSVGNRSFTYGLLEKLRSLGTQVTETGFGEYGLDLSKTGANRGAVTSLLDSLSVTGFGVSEGRDTSATATATPTRATPYVLIQKAVFNDSTDATMIGKKVEFAIRSERLV